MPTLFTLTFACRDEPGIVAAVSSCLFQQGANITDAQDFNDPGSRRFFSRVEFECLGASPPSDAEQRIRRSITPVLDRLGASWELNLVTRQKKVLVMVSKLDHCLADILYRWRVGELPMELVGVVANHPRETYPHIDFSDVPFHYLPVTEATKVGQENRLRGLIGEYEVDLVVLARYMQILSDGLTGELAGRCINIHHSFLPGFTGARPYHQAHARGVKLIGATAHYVTPELDEGPIIAQDVERVTHRDSPHALVRKGRDIERRVLATAVNHHLHNRVLLNHNTAVVFAE